jgi:hypothetical protein
MTANRFHGPYRMPWSLAALAALALTTTVSAAGAQHALDPANADDQMRLRAKISCSLVEGRPTLYWWSGRMYSRVPGERDRLLFKVHGMNVRQCRTKEDPVRGFCYRSVSREVMFYLDPATDEVARKWRNPWTGREVDVVHVANDPVNARDWICARDSEGRPVDRGADITVRDGLLLEGGSAARLFYKNPLAGEYQDYVGGTYHAMEFGTTAANAREALDARDTELENAVISWGRISRWLPWMEMGDRDGLVVFHTAGMRLDRWEQLPAVVRREIEANYPIYREPPPLDDPRPNETSWTVFKRFIDAKRAAETAKTGEGARP